MRSICTNMKECSKSASEKKQATEQIPTLFVFFPENIHA